MMGSGIGQAAPALSTRNDASCGSRLSSTFLGCSVPHATPSHVRMTVKSSKHTLKIEMAISKAKKDETVERARQELENCYLIASINYQRFTVKQMSDLRSKMPESTKLIVMKNSLLEKAIQGTKFEALNPRGIKGMNAFLFVHSEEIPPALKPFREMQKELKLEDNDYTGAVFEGKFYSPEEFKTLETMPSRAEVYGQLLGVLKGPSTNLVATLQGPAQNLVFTLKAYVEKLEKEQGQA